MLAAPLLIAAAAMSAPQTFLFLAIAGALSDASDGTIARLLNNTTARGAALDSRADALFYSATIIGLVILFPARLMAEWPTMTTVVLAYSFPILVGYYKFARITSYHTWLARLSIVILTPAIVSWLWFDSIMLFRIGVVVLAVSAAEELAITHTLNRPRDNIPHLFHLLTTHLQRREHEH